MCWEIMRNSNHIYIVLINNEYYSSYRNGIRPTKYVLSVKLRFQNLSYYIEFVDDYDLSILLQIWYNLLLKYNNN